MKYWNAVSVHTSYLLAETVVLMRNKWTLWRAKTTE